MHREDHPMLGVRHTGAKIYSSPNAIRRGRFPLEEPNPSNSEDRLIPNRALIRCPSANDALRLVAHPVFKRTAVQVVTCRSMKGHGQRLRGEKIQVKAP